MDSFEMIFEDNVTVYKTTLEPAKGNILYFHGGGFIFGQNEDLPRTHIDKLNAAGYNIVAVNYPLAPESELSAIVDYVTCFINIYVKELSTPYFLWGRSAGAYLSLLVASKELDLKPNGIISYYGYGFLTQNWYNTPSAYYLAYPLVDDHAAKNLIGNDMIFAGPANPRYLIYLHARQKGTWLKTLSQKTEADFLEVYGLEHVDFTDFPPVLLAHNTRDNDVPYDESLNLHNKMTHSKLLTFQSEDHDFDKNTDSLNTLKLLKETVLFLDENL